MEKEKIKCSDCDQLFRDRFNMWRHFMRKHYNVKSKEEKKKKSEKPKPTCSLCGQTFYKNGNLKRHSKFCKKAKVSTSENYNFNQITDFELWKRQIEIETKSCYVRKSSYKLQNGSFRTKYCCHRSGYFKPQGKNMRRLKILGSNKINGICPAKMIAIISPSGEVEVSFFPNHHGHSMELQRVTLSKTERAEIADKIAKKIPYKEILSSVQNSSVEVKSKRLQLLTKKDLHNIEKEFKITNTTYTYEEMAVEVFLEGPANGIINDPVHSITLTDKPRSSLSLISLDQVPNESLLPTNPAPTSDFVQSSGVQHHMVCSSTEQENTFVVEVPFGIEQDNFSAPVTPSKDQGNIEKIKDEMRKEFEQVLSSIRNESQALNAKKWIYSFHSLVHSEHFPFQIVIDDGASA